MNRVIFLACFVFLPLSVLHAQLPTKIFEFTQPKYKVAGSLYHSIDFIDSRKDGLSIGRVYIGPLRNHEADLVIPDHFGRVLEQVLNSLTDSTATDGKLLLQLNRFSFCEISDTRYCFLSAALYVEKNSTYTKLGYLDTVMVFTNSGFLNSLMKSSSAIISDFLAKNLQRQPELNDGYSYDNVKNMDSIDKSHIPVYADTVYKNGIYSSYLAFKNQQPDINGKVETKRDGSISSVKLPDSTGKLKKIKLNTLYAVVNEGHPFAVTEYGYFPISRIFNDFYFMGIVRVASSAGEKAIGQAQLGLVGLALASIPKGEKYYIMIDHVNGRLIHLRYIPSEDSQ